jgi:CRP-like cAMP-binding protein
MKEMLTNKILTGLRDMEFDRLMPLLHPVSLSTGERLSEAGEAAPFVYFPESCVISCLANMQDGKSAEVGMIGLEGVADITGLVKPRPAVHSLNVSIGGSALRVRTDDLEREMLRSEGLQQSLLGYAAEYVTQLYQRSACAIFHMVEQRFAVWLLLHKGGGDSDYSGANCRPPRSAPRRRYCRRAAYAGCGSDQLQARKFAHR